MRTYDPVPETGPRARPTGSDPLVALGNFLRGTFDWLAGRLDVARRSDVDAYLSQSSDSADLERRIRQLERGAFFSRYY
jgi:Protein of unknown function (DUF3563)